MALVLHDHFLPPPMLKMMLFDNCHGYCCHTLLCMASRDLHNIDLGWFFTYTTTCIVVTTQIVVAHQKVHCHK